MHILLLHKAANDSEAGLAVQQIHFGDATGVPVEAIDLLFLDTRGLTEERILAGYEQVGQLRRRWPIRRAVLLSPDPGLDVVVRAMRAGFQDILPNPLSWRDTLRVLRACLPTTAARRRALGLLAGARLFSRDAISSASHQRTTDDDRRSRQREERLQREESRLAAFRDSLEARAVQLDRHHQRLNGQLAQIHQAEAMIATASAAPFATATPVNTLIETMAGELQELANRLNERAQALDHRERMLRELEATLIRDSQCA